MLPTYVISATIDRKLNFNEHVTNLCDEESKKAEALARISPYIPQTQKRLLMNAYFMSLVWMNLSRTLNNRISGLHKRALSLVYNDFSSIFLKLLEKHKSVTIHHRKLQFRLKSEKKKYRKRILSLSSKNYGILIKKCVETVLQNSCNHVKKIWEKLRKLRKSCQ